MSALNLLHMLNLARALLLVAALVTFEGCGDNPLPSCVPPTPSAVLDVQTCVDHQDVGICRWDTAGPDHVSRCVVPSGIDQGVECVETGPPNHYDQS